VRSTQDRIFAATTATVLAVLLILFVFGRGPGSLVWLAGGAPRWLPFAGSGVSWMPWVDPHPKPVAAVQSSPSPAAKPAAAVSSAPQAPSPSPSPVTKPASPRPSPKPSPVASPSPSPSPAPEPKPSPSPSPSPKPSPSPTPSTLFTDNFEQDALGSSVPNWTESGGGWSVAADGSHVLATSSGSAVISAGSTSWTSYKVTAAVRNMGSSGYARVLARYQSNQYFYACGPDSAGNLFLGKMYGGTWYTFATTPYPVSPDVFYKVEFTVSGTSLTCKVIDSSSGRTATVTSSQSYFANGSIGAAASGDAEFDNFSVVTVG
jgi:hypothetical protein